MSCVSPLPAVRTKRLRNASTPSICFCGGSFELTLAHSCVKERCLQLWISRFHQSGIGGITYRPKCGRRRLLAAEQIHEQILPVIDDPARADRHHWTAVGLCGWLKDEQGLELSYRTLVRYLHEQGYARRIPRPVPEPPDATSGSNSARPSFPGSPDFWKTIVWTSFSGMKQVSKAIPGQGNAG